MTWLKVVVSTFGVINIIGGFIGFMAAKSIWSLVVGAAAGLLLLLAVARTKQNSALGWRSAGILTAILVAFWAFRIYEVQSQGKSPTMAIGNLGLAVVVLGCLLYGHFSSRARHAG